MENHLLSHNAQTLELEFQWFFEFVSARIHLYFDPVAEVQFPHAPDLSGDASSYAQLVQHYNATPAERLVMLLALGPHLKPHLLDLFFLKNKVSERGWVDSYFGTATK